MRLIGKSELFVLAQSAAADLRGGTLALCAELESAAWRTVLDARLAYPRAALAGQRLVIDLDDRHCAVVAIQYEVGIALVEFAGLSMDWSGAPRTAKGKRA